MPRRTTGSGAASTSLGDCGGRWTKKKTAFGDVLSGRRGVWLKPFRGRRVRLWASDWSVSNCGRAVGRPAGSRSAQIPRGVDAIALRGLRERVPPGSHFFFFPRMPSTSRVASGKVTGVDRHLGAPRTGKAVRRPQPVGVGVHLPGSPGARFAQEHDVRWTTTSLPSRLKASEGRRDRGQRKFFGHGFRPNTPGSAAFCLSRL